MDILSEGRLRLGLGAGWNSVEYEALGQDFSTRGKRLEEQIGLPAEIGTDARIKRGGGGTDDLLRAAERWRDAGATHLSVDTMGSGLSGLDAHLDALAKAGEALQLEPL